MFEEFDQHCVYKFLPLFQDAILINIALGESLHQCRRRFNDNRKLRLAALRGTVFVIEANDLLLSKRAFFPFS